MVINILNRYDFRDLMLFNNINNENIHEFKDTYIISINDSEGEHSISYFNTTNASNVLVLHFDDIDNNISEVNLKPMSIDQGKKILSFVNNIKNNSNNNTQIIIHCTAGQNRSGSVGRFVADFLEYNIERLHSDNPIIKGNPIVSSILNRLWLWGHYIDK